MYPGMITVDKHARLVEAEMVVVVIEHARCFGGVVSSYNFMNIFCMRIFILVSHNLQIGNNTQKNNIDVTLLVNIAMCSFQIFYRKF